MRQIRIKVIFPFVSLVLNGTSDIYFPKYNVAIEYNGRQHYVEVEHFGGKLGFENTLKRDELKRQKCKERERRL